MDLKLKAKKLLKKLNSLDENNDKISSEEREYFELKYILEAFKEIEKPYKNSVILNDGCGL